MLLARMLHKRQIIAALIAPLTAPVLFAVILSSPNIGKNWPDFIDTLLLIMAFGVPIAYIVAVLFGLPLYKLMKKYGVINVWTVAFGGAIAAILPILLLQLMNAELLSFNLKDAKVYVMMFISGLAVGLVFWVIGLSHKNK